MPDAARAIQAHSQCTTCESTDCLVIVLGNPFVLVSIDNLVIIMCLSSDVLVTQILVFSNIL